ncbi:MAG: type I methionyl aminopeptidase [Desulfuromonadales bacterium]|nr:type I methionyl aminopeptidase [Desulfuromonadales bacterium]
MIVVKSRQEIERMRTSGRMVAEILQLLKERIRPGVTTRELDRLAEQETKKRKARPAFKGYGGFPFTICASPNEQVVHGFSTDEPLKDGDILSIDFGLIYDGFYGDSAFTVPVGTVDRQKSHLMAVTEKSLALAIEQAVPEHRLGDISSAVQGYVEQQGFSVVREFVGHGIGRELHEEPQVPNFGKPGQGPRLKEGMVLAIEPMINAGSAAVKVLSDGWTAVTRDGLPSAHFEHTVAVGPHGPEILTRV